MRRQPVAFWQQQHHGIVLSAGREKHIAFAGRAPSAWTLVSSCDSIQTVLRRTYKSSAFGQLSRVIETQPYPSLKMSSYGFAPLALLSTVTVLFSSRASAVPPPYSSASRSASSSSASLQSSLPASASYNYLEPAIYLSVSLHP